MDKVYISWSVENMITVTLMVALGYFLVAAVSSVIRSKGLGGGLSQRTASSGQSLSSGG